MALEPNIWDGEAPSVEHGVPAEGTAMVPVEFGGAGLTPAELISVEPKGIPVGETGELDEAPPSGDVAPIYDPVAVHVTLLD